MSFIMTYMKWGTMFESILLGAVQGLTEFLPVSSSAHLILISYLQSGHSLSLTLNVALHFGTLMAVFIYFWRDWKKIGDAFFRKIFKKESSYESQVLLPGLIIGTLPAGVVGLLAKDWIERVLHHPSVVILPLALVGVFMWWVDDKTPSERPLKSLSIKDAFLIGVAQTFALIPGVSRSGATITCGRILRFKREDAARFSFLLGTPAMFGATLLESKHILEVAHDPAFYVAVGTSTLVGCLAIGGFLAFLRRFGFAMFAIYRCLLALCILYFVLSYTDPF